MIDAREHNTTPDTSSTPPPKRKLGAKLKELPKHIRFWGALMLVAGAAMTLYPPLIPVGTAIASAGCGAIISGQVAASRTRPTTQAKEATNVQD
jgi:hypothetical protein